MRMFPRWGRVVAVCVLFALQFTRRMLEITREFLKYSIRFSQILSVKMVGEIVQNNARASQLSETLAEKQVCISLSSYFASVLFCQRIVYKKAHGIAEEHAHAGMRRAVNGGKAWVVDVHFSQRLELWGLRVA